MGRVLRRSREGRDAAYGYANKSAEENFCETFMLYKLYRDQLQTRAPLRERWMASNPLLGDVVPPVPAALAANA